MTTVDLGPDLGRLTLTLTRGRPWKGWRGVRRVSRSGQPMAWPSAPQLVFADGTTVTFALSLDDMLATPSVALSGTQVDAIINHGDPTVSLVDPGSGVPWAHGRWTARVGAGTGGTGSIASAPDDTVIIVGDRIEAIGGGSGGGLTAAQVEELARDAVGAALVAGAGITITPDDGADTITITGTGGGGTSDHGALTGLGDDDHPHYLTNARGDARYATTTHHHDSTYVKTSDHAEMTQDVVGAMITTAGGTYNDTAGTITLPSGGGGGGLWSTKSDTTLSAATTQITITPSTGVRMIRITLLDAWATVAGDAEADVRYQCNGDTAANYLLQQSEQPQVTDGLMGRIPGQQSGSWGRGILEAVLMINGSSGPKCLARAESAYTSPRWAAAINTIQSSAWNNRTDAVTSIVVFSPGTQFGAGTRIIIEEML